MNDSEKETQGKLQITDYVFMGLLLSLILLTITTNVNVKREMDNPSLKDPYECVVGTITNKHEVRKSFGRSESYVKIKLNNDDNDNIAHKVNMETYVLLDKDDEVYVILDPSYYTDINDQVVKIFANITTRDKYIKKQKEKNRKINVL